MKVSQSSPGVASQAAGRGADTNPLTLLYLDEPLFQGVSRCGNFYVPSRTYPAGVVPVSRADMVQGEPKGVCLVPRE